MPTRRCSGGMCRPVVETTLPFNLISPETTGSNPAMARSVVVFPQPDGPNKQMISPFRAEKEIPSTAGEPVSYEQVTSLSSSTTGLSPGAVIFVSEESCLRSLPKMNAWQGRGYV